MRRLLPAVLSLLLVAAALPAAEDEYSPALLKRIGLTDAQIDQVAVIWEEGRVAIQQAQAEVAVQRAILAKQLLNADPDMKEVERILRLAMEQEVKVRLAQIQREVKARKLIGDRRWAQLRELARQRAAADKPAAAKPQPSTQKDGEADVRENRVRALLKELLELLGEKD